MKLVHEALEGELVTELKGPFGHELLDHLLADEVACGVPGLGQVEMLLVPHRAGIRGHIAAWSPFSGEVHRLLNRPLVTMHHQAANGARRPLRHEDPNELARLRAVVEETGVHHPLFHSRRHPLGPAVPDVV